MTDIELIFDRAQDAGLMAAYGGDPARTTQDRLMDAMTAWRAVLTEAGLVPGASANPQKRIEQAAQYLAQESDHPRYTQVGPEGWRVLLTSLTDVQVAYSAATTRAGKLDEETLSRLSRARQVLTAHIGRTRRETAS